MYNVQLDKLDSGKWGVSIHYLKTFPNKAKYPEDIHLWENRFRFKFMAKLYSKLCVKILISCMKISGNECSLEDVYKDHPNLLKIYKVQR